MRQNVINNRILGVLSYIDKIKNIFLLFVFLFLLTGLVFYKVIFITNTYILSSFWILYGAIVSVFLLSRIPCAYLYEDKHDVIYPDSAYPSVSVLITAKNEEKIIFKTISSSINSQYPGKLECIVINDGSTDNTKKEIIRAQRVYGDIIKLISFPKNLGKREAMAAGVNNAQNEIIIFVDSDSFLATDSIRHITEHFLADKRIGAVSGNTKVKNKDTNLLTKIQSIHYAVSFDVYKTSESIFHSVTCCPGCFSAYRKITIKPLIGKLKEQKFLGVKGNFGDDRGLTSFVLKTKWNVIYCEKARATTVVPEKFSVYWRQQLRWKKSWIREGLLAGLFMWRRNFFASLGFYINFSFPILGPILAGKVFIHSIIEHNPLLFLLFMTGFMILGTVFSLFVRVSRGAENWMYMPIFSLFFILIFTWQIFYALITLRNSRWGTR